MSEETTYWGILCRTCSEPVAFDIRPCQMCGPGAANVRPGAIRCVHGHNHIYFPRDFRLFPSSVPITAATIQENRQAYLAINPSPEPSSDPSVCADRANDGLCSLDSQISHGPGLHPT